MVDEAEESKRKKVILIWLLLSCRVWIVSRQAQEQECLAKTSHVSRLHDASKHWQGELPHPEAWGHAAVRGLQPRFLVLATLKMSALSDFSRCTLGTLAC